MPRETRLYQPGVDRPFKLSRSKIDLFVECQRCFYLDRKTGIPRPRGFPFNLNNAVDTLLKKEFDIYRRDGKPHPLITAHGIKARPFAHDKLNTWRTNFDGVERLHSPTNLLITGAVDDLWVNDENEVIVVDYKATSKDGEVSLDAEWQNSYKRQMETYQWLLRGNNLTVADTGYFVYCNGLTSPSSFDCKLHFDIKVIPYTGKTDWIEPTLESIKKLLDQDVMPEPGPGCEYCPYVSKRHPYEDTSVHQ